MGSIGSPDARLSPGVRTPSSDVDPFNLSFSGSQSGRHRYSSFDTGLFTNYTASSPTQVKQVLESQLADTERRIQDASKLGSTLLDQRSEIEERLRDVDTRPADNAMAPELRQKLFELERAYSEVGRETARQFVPKRPRVGTGIGEAIAEDDMHSANGRPSPSKPSIGSPRKSRNGLASPLQDIEFATEISTSLLAQVRALQTSLSEKDEALKRANADKSTMQADAEIFALKLRSLDDNEQRIKDENWQLEIQNQRLLTEIKESAFREQRLLHNANTARSSQSNAQKEYDELRDDHEKLNGDYEALRRQLDTELTKLHRNLTTRDNEADALQKRLDELAAQNEDLVKAAAYRNRLDQENADAFAAAGTDENMLVPTTPDPSPPGSPVKATPRHGALESETLKSSLHHAHKMIQNLKNNIHREKTEKIELKRMLQDARDELEAKRGEGGTAAAAANKKRAAANQGIFKKPARIDQLGGSKNAMDEIINDPSWEEYDDSPTKFRQTGRRDMYDLSTDASEAFETANEDNAGTTETEGFQTGRETLAGDSEGELTETEDTHNNRARQGGLAEHRRGQSFQSTASDDLDFFNPSSPPSSKARQRLRALRDARSEASDSPMSFSSAVNRGNHNLAAELEDLDGDGSSIAASTPARNQQSHTSTPATFVRDATASALHYVASMIPGHIDTSDKGTMTEPGDLPDPPLPATSTFAASAQNSADMGGSGRANAVTVPSGITNTTTMQWLPQSLEMKRSFAQLNDAQQEPQATRELSLNLSPIVGLSVEPVESENKGADSVQSATQPSGTAEVSMPYSSLAGSTPLVPDFPQSHFATHAQIQQTHQDVDSNGTETPVTPRSSASVTRSTAASSVASAQQTPTGQSLESQQSTAFSTPGQAQSGIPAPTQNKPESQTPTSLPPSSMAFIDNLLKHPSAPDANQTDTTIPGPDNTQTRARGYSTTTADTGGSNLSAATIDRPATTGAARGHFPMPPPIRAPQFDSSEKGAQNAGPQPTLAGGLRPAIRTLSGNSPLLDVKPSQTQDVTRSEAGPQSTSAGGLRAPFRTVSGNPLVSDVRPSQTQDAVRPEVDQQLLEKRLGKQRAVSDAESLTIEPPKREITPILSNTTTSPRAARSASLTARFAEEPATYIEPQDFGAYDRSGGQLRAPGGPPLPSGHREAIALASKTPPPANVPTSMGPPHMPPTSWRGSGQGPPRELYNPPQQGNGPHAGKPQSRNTSFTRPPESQRSSLSSYPPDVEDRQPRRMTRGPSGPPEDPTLANADPRMIQAITQTMIGEFLWKYTRKTGRDEHSDKRHRRFFWIHPYTRTLYWSNQDPSHAGKTELKAKSVGIEAVRVVSDESHQPPGLHNKSIIVVTPGRSIKFTAPTAQRHETWFNALSYLLLRTPATDPKNAGAVIEQQSRDNSRGSQKSSMSSRFMHRRSETQSTVNSTEDVAEFDPNRRSRTPQASASRRSQSGGRSVNTNTTSATEPSSGPPSQPSQSQTSTATNRYNQAGLVQSAANQPPAEAHPTMRASAELFNPNRSAQIQNPNHLQAQAQVQDRLSNDAAPAPNVPTMLPKDYGPPTNDVNAPAPRTPVQTEGAFKKPAIPQTPKTGAGNGGNGSEQRSTSARGRIGSFTDRFSFLGRGRSKSRGRSETTSANEPMPVNHGMVDTTGSPRAPSATRTGGPAPGNAAGTGGHSHDHVHNHTGGDGTGLENVRACCDGKHDVSSISHRPTNTTRGSSRSRSRQPTVGANSGDGASIAPSMAPSTMASSWRSRFSDAGSVGGRGVDAKSAGNWLDGRTAGGNVPSLTRDMR